VNGKQEMVIVASSLNRPILALYALPEIAGAEQLKGKAIASDKPGTVADYGARGLCWG
jgi:hypothetical protein